MKRRKRRGRMERPEFVERLDFSTEPVGKPWYPENRNRSAARELIERAREHFAQHPDETYPLERSELARILIHLDDLESQGEWDHDELARLENEKARAKLHYLEGASADGVLRGLVGIPHGFNRRRRYDPIEVIQDYLLVRYTSGDLQIVDRDREAAGLRTWRPLCIHLGDLRRLRLLHPRGDQGVKAQLLDILETIGDAPESEHLRGCAKRLIVRPPLNGRLDCRDCDVVRGCRYLVRGCPLDPVRATEAVAFCHGFEWPDTCAKELRRYRKKLEEADAQRRAWPEGENLLAPVPKGWGAGCGTRLSTEEIASIDPPSGRYYEEQKIAVPPSGSKVSPEDLRGLLRPDPVRPWDPDSGTT